MNDADAEQASRLNRILGTLLVITIICLSIADATPEYVASGQLSAILAVLALVLLGFGSIIVAWIKHR